MRREWRSNAQSSAWRAKSTGVDPHGFAAVLIAAFVDRLPNGWRALADRETTADERLLIEDLRLLDRMRHTTAPAPDAAQSHSRRFGASVGLGLVLALASVQTLCCLAAVAGQALSGHPVVHASRLVLAGGFSAGAIVVAATAARDPRTLGLLATLACAASAFARGSTFGLPLPSFLHAHLILRGVVPIAFAPAALWQFALAFPRVQRFTTFDIAARRATAFAWALGAALFGAALGAELDLIHASPIAGPDGLTHLFWHLFVLGALPALLVLTLRSRRTLPPERQRIARFAGTLALGSAPLLAVGVVRMSVPGVEHWFTDPAVSHLWIDRLVLWSLAATPVASCAVLLLDHPFEPQTPAALPSPNRLAAAGLAVGLMTPFAVLVSLLYRLRRVPMADLPGSGHAWPLAAALAGSVAALFVAVWRAAAGGRFVMLATDRGRLTAAIERIRLTRGDRELASVVAGEIAAGTEASFWRALFPASGGSFIDPAGDVGPLASSGALSVILLRTPGAIDLSERALRALLPAAERAWVETHEVEMAVALRSRSDIPIAVLVFGRSRAGRFDRRDRWFATTLVEAAAVARSGTEAVRHGRAARRDRQEAAFECEACGIVAASLSMTCACRSGLVLSALPRRLADTFAIERRLGAGGMGVVYLGRDLRLQRAVALKTVPALRGEAAARLRIEARAMGALNHEALATLYGLEFWRGTPVLVEEYLPGGTLAARLAAGPLQPSEAIALAIRLADAIAYMHQCGVLHGDIKPGNIAFTAHGSAKLLDFGLSTLIGSAAHARAGTPDYLPPECSGHTVVVPSLDLWALAVTVLEMVAGREARAVLRASKAASALVDAFSPPGHIDFCPFFQRALASDPSARFNTAGDMREALRRLS